MCPSSNGKRLAAGGYLKGKHEVSMCIPPTLLLDGNSEIDAQVWNVIVN